LIEHGNQLARSPMLGGVGSEPILAAKGILRHWAEAVPGEPIGAFPTIFDTKARALGREPLVERALAHSAPGFIFTVWPRHLIMQPQNLGDPFPQVRSIVGPRRETPDVHRPKVHRL